jgi:hypothetical protein
METMLCRTRPFHAGGCCRPVFSRFDAISDLVMTYLSTPEMKKPSVDSWYSDKFAENIKLTSEQWAKVVASVGDYRKYLV